VRAGTAWTGVLAVVCGCTGVPPGPGFRPAGAEAGTPAVPETAGSRPATGDDATAAARPEFDLEAWLASVARGGPTDPTALRKRLEEAELRLLDDAPVEQQLPELCAGAPTTFGGVRRIDGQLDDDDDLETAVRIVLAVSAPPEPRERCEEIWLGVFDPAPGGPVLRLMAHRRLYHCLHDERDAAITAGFSDPASAADPAFWMERQEIDACGSLTDYRYQRFVVRVGREGLEVERSHTESTTVDRTDLP
jgi:hypothetical protein